MAKKKVRGRVLNGILLLNKPYAMSSNQALQRVKGIYFAQKAGHTGSLDPLATGMLPICFGEATKFSQFLLDADKHYQVTAQLGVRTTTCDAEGEVISTHATATLTEEKIEHTLKQFRGAIEQIPSMFSALKHQGVPLYKLARQGIEVERKSRTVQINSLSIIDFDQQNARLTLDVKCSKGTYIRNLIDDLGQALACAAHVKNLHRLSVANFSSKHMYTLEALQDLREQRAFTVLDSFLLLVEAISKDLPYLKLTAAAAFRLQQGQVLNDIVFPNVGLVNLYGENDNFLGIGEVAANRTLIAKRLLKIV